METELKIYLIVIGVMSFITFILYAADKHKAIHNQWRIRERTLLLFGVFGGAAGALLGMELCRHKTKHWYFWLVNILSLGIHFAVYMHLGVLPAVKALK